MLCLHPFFIRYRILAAITRSLFSSFFFSSYFPNILFRNPCVCSELLAFDSYISLLWIIHFIATVTAFSESIETFQDDYEWKRELCHQFFHVLWHKNLWLIQKTNFIYCQHLYNIKSFGWLSNRFSCIACLNLT